MPQVDAVAVVRGDVAGECVVAGKIHVDAILGVVRGGVVGKVVVGRIQVDAVEVIRGIVAGKRVAIGISQADAAVVVCGSVVGEGAAVAKSKLDGITRQANALVLHTNLGAVGEDDLTCTLRHLPPCYVLPVINRLAVDLI